jgi:hypothetical protein
MGMNPGYLSIVFYTVFLILIVTGWKRALLWDVSTPAVLLFLAAYLPAAHLEVQAGGAGVNGLAVLLAICTAAGIFAMATGKQRLAAIGAALFLGCFNFLLGEFGRWMPSVSLSHADIIGTLIIALSAMLLFRMPAEQITLATAALLIGNALQQWAHARWLAPHFGGARFRDQWWIAAGSALVLSWVLSAAMAKGRSLAFRLPFYWKGRRS